jgi:hypothetical protein
MCVYSLKVNCDNHENLEPQYQSFVGGNNSFIQQESLITLQVTPAPGDQTKRFLYASGSARIIHLYKVDPLLKCASMPIFQLWTNHENTISSLLNFGLPDGTIYVATASIDRNVGLFKIGVPDSQRSSPSKVPGSGGAQMKSLIAGGVPKGRAPWN